MRVLLIVSATCLVQLAAAQFRMTHTPETSMLSENNANCIAGDGDAVHVVWHEEQESQLYAGVYYRRSLDNGETWEEASWLGFGYNPSIAVQGHELHVVCSAGLLRYGRSADNGNTWTFIPLPSIYGEHPTIAVSGSLVHLVWHTGWGEYGEIQYCRSEDRGLTWSAVQTLSHDSHAKAKYPSMAIHESYVHLVYQYEEGLWYQRSDDFGVTWPDLPLGIWPYGIHPAIAASGRKVVIAAVLDVSGSLFTMNSTDHGQQWNLPQFTNLLHGYQAILSTHLTTNGHHFFLSWNQMVNGTWSILTTHSNDGGFHWSPFGEVSPITGHFSCRPFALLKGRDIHMIATDNIHEGGKHEIFYLKTENVLFEAGNTYVDWGFRTGNAEREVCQDIVVDGEGHVYATGYFEGQIDIDPGPDEWWLTSEGRKDMFVAKYDPDGHLMWARNIGGTFNDAGTAIALDAYGRIYIAGGFENLVNFDPLGEGVHLFSNGGQDIFLLCLDQEGQFISCYDFGGDGADAPADIGITKSGHIVFAGVFSGAVDFNRYGYFPLTSNGSSDIFLCILDAEGKLIHAQAMGGQQADNVSALAMDEQGQIYLTGTFRDTLDLLSGPDLRQWISKGQSDVFMLAVDSIGQYRWSGTLGSTGWDTSDDLTIDAKGDLILTGTYPAVLSIETDSTNITLAPYEQSSAFLVQMNEHGQVHWAESIFLHGQSPLQLATNDRHDIFLAGSYTYIGLDPASTYSLMNTEELEDLFLLKYTSDGGLSWFTTFGGPGHAYINAMTGNRDGDVYLAGTYTEELYLEPGNLHAPLGDPAGNQRDFYLAKLVECLPVEVHLTATACDVYLAPDGISEWSATGVYQQTLQTRHGCDSIITVDLTILESSANTIKAYTCDAYISPSGHVWEESGIYSDTLTNVLGCDSILSIQLFIQRDTQWVNDVIACESFQTPQGHVITTSGTVTDAWINQAGCDSIVIYEVEIHAAQTSTHTVTACGSYTTPDSLYTWTTSGTYQYTVLTNAGCDSLLIYHVDIHPLMTTAYATTACQAYTTPDGLYTWTTSGVYQYNLLSASGCDSSITVDLQIVPLDISVTPSDTALIANHANAAYQWLDCATGAWVPGETSQVFIPATGGMYAAILQWYECTDTTACYFAGGVNASDPASTQPLRLYPNPARDQLYLDGGGRCEIIGVQMYDVLGRLQLEKTISNCDVLYLPPHIRSGVYWICLHRKNIAEVHRVIVE